MQLSGKALIANIFALVIHLVCKQLKQIITTHYIRQPCAKKPPTIQIGYIIKWIKKSSYVQFDNNYKFKSIILRSSDNSL